jgi:DNA-directed RNA polymerase subunit H (RpoH/RPB5)
MTFEVNKHILVPKHSKLNDSEKKKLLEEHHIEIKSLPKILKDDPAIEKLGIKAGDVIKIERKSITAGTAIYYRVVIEG